MCYGGHSVKIILGGTKRNGADFVASTWALANHVVDRIDDEIDALELARTSACDAIVICPATADAALCRAMAAARTVIPRSAIIVVPSATAIGVDALLGAGANDVITAREGKHLLLARLTAVTRRAWGHAAAEITIGALKIGLTSQTCDVGGRVIALTPMEYRLAEAMALRRGQVISRQTLLELLYRAGDEPLPKSIDLFAHNIRRKLASVDGAPRLATRGRGLILQDNAPAAAPSLLSSSAA